MHFHTEPTRFSMKPILKYLVKFSAFQAKIALNISKIIFLLVKSFNKFYTKKRSPFFKTFIENI